MFTIKMPVFGPLVEKNIIARTMRTLGTLVASGVPILEALHITKETSGNAIFEGLFQKVYESIREGESIAKPMKDNARPTFQPMSVFFIWLFCGAPVGVLAGAVLGGMLFPSMPKLLVIALGALLVGTLISMLVYLVKMNKRILDDMVINMVDVGEETGELDTMLYKVADTYDEEVAVLTESLMSLMEPLMIILLGGIVGFIVIALFLPLIALITKLSG
jgi:type IV pilus assembly protein PilC